MKISQFKTNTQLEQDGVWIDVGAGLELKVARLGNPKYRNYLRVIGKPYSHQLRHGSVDTEIIEDLTRKAVAKHVLLEWKNLEDEDGNLIPFSEEKAVELFVSHPDFYNMVVEIANDAEVFKKDMQGDSEGNSESASNG